MGILDDAIREHLELKRQHGAEDEDLERLENEAFGPAARPGDPDFAAPSTETGEWATGEQEAAAEPPSEELVAEAAEVTEAPSEELPAAAEEAAQEPSAPAPEASAPPPAEEPSSGGLGVFDAEAEFGDTAEEIPADATPAERARIEHAHLDDTVDHPAPTQLGPEDEAEPDPTASAPAEAGVTERVAPEPEPSAPDTGAEPEAAAPEAPEKDIFAGEDFGLEEMDLSISDEPESGEQPAAGKGKGKGEDDEGEGDDLLEETPDFLQETEGEDLWFEQGPPRDFDFDDD